MSELITTTPQSTDHSVQLEIVKFNELTSVMNNQQIRLATVAIADFVNRQEADDKQMLSVTPEAIAERHAAVIALEPPQPASTESSLATASTEGDGVANFADRLVGYVGAMTPIEHTCAGTTRRMTEVGSLKVSRRLRGHGIGTVLFGKILQATEAEGLTPYAFCNADSLPIAESLAGREITYATEIPPEALELCKTCPLYGQATDKSYGCCDTVMVWNSTNRAPKTPSH